LATLWHQQGGGWVGPARRAAAGWLLRAGIAAWLGVLGLLAVGGTAAPGPPRQPYEFKAALLQKLAQFVEWPASAQGAPGQPFVIGILGRDPFEGWLEKVLGSKTVNGRPIEFRRYTRVEEALKGHCHLLFIAASEKPRLDSELERLRTAPILTVGDTEAFGEKGVMVNLFNSGANVRFEIDAARISEAGLAVSSKLLAVAAKVRGHPKPGG